MSPELEFILQVAHEQSPASDERIHALIREGLNWNEALACAMQHKLVLVLHERMQGRYGEWLDRSQQLALAEFARGTAIKNMAFLGETLRLLRLFENEKIPAIPHRGPILAWLAYRNFAQR